MFGSISLFSPVDVISFPFFGQINCAAAVNALPISNMSRLLPPKNGTRIFISVQFPLSPPFLSYICFFPSLGYKFLWLSLSLSCLFFSSSQGSKSLHSSAEKRERRSYFLRRSFLPPKKNKLEIDIRSHNSGAPGKRLISRPTNSNGVMLRFTFFANLNAVFGCKTT